MIFLFDSARTAEEVAFQLRGNYDGCNGVEFEKFDVSGIKFVVDSLEGNFCFERTFCYCESEIHQAVFAATGSGKSIMTSLIMELQTNR
jgi:hypothetical protein